MTESTPQDIPCNGETNDTTTTYLYDIIKDLHAIATTLESTYETAISNEIKHIIACLISLDIVNYLGRL